MDLKSIYRDPEAAVGQRWGSPDNCDVHDQILSLLGELRDLKATVKEAKDEKGRVSRQFREAKADPDRFAELKERMAKVSQTLSELEQRRKKCERNLLALFGADERREPSPFPGRFSKTPSGKGPGDGRKLRIVVADDQDAAAWDAYVAGNERASLYHLFSWKTIVEQAFGHDCFYFAARDDDGRICGVLPLVSLKSRLFGSYGVSLPFFNYGGPLADDQMVTEALLEEARGEAHRQHWQHLEYRTCEPGMSLPASSRKVSMILNLPDSGKTLDANLGAKVRAQCNQANRRKPEIAFGGAELLDDYYTVFSRNMRDLGTPVYSRRFFETMLDNLPNHCTVVTVRIDGRPAGAAFLAGYRDMLEIPWASTLREFNDLNVNMWMYRKILHHAIDSGFGYFDFGRSTVNAGTYKFKKQWGAQPLKHYWYYRMMPQTSAKEDTLASSTEASTTGTSALPALNPDNPKFRLAIAAWKRLPLFVANTLGPHIVKNLP
ncbi:FemAB family XrtA/PEP-CTERM system-associated protein [Gilvimarinus sp. F26214L]|uniref:FemAB family XrtA/PEP-CTERM system-associated protein n=1 Tax=Gilvimarinus sp. DZF01 TaxID=3461371 RepID=UPI0040460500